MLDVAYQHGPFDENDELRYSLRSIAANVPHGRVVIAGHRPAWVDPSTTTHLSVVQRPGRKHDNALANLRAIVACDDLTSDVILVNDDHYVTVPLDTLPVLHRGPLEQAVRERFESSPDWHARGLDDTLTLLRRVGHDDPLCYDLHVPSVANRDRLADVLDLIRTEGAGLDPARILWRTVYGNLQQLGGTYAADVKVRDPRTDDLTGPYVSTDEVTFEFGAIGAALRSAFPAQCRYERHNGKARP